MNEEQTPVFRIDNDFSYLERLSTLCDKSICEYTEDVREVALGALVEVRRMQAWLKLTQDHASMRSANEHYP